VFVCEVERAKQQQEALVAQFSSQMEQKLKEQKELLARQMQEQEKRMAQEIEKLQSKLQHLHSVPASQANSSSGSNTSDQVAPVDTPVAPDPSLMPTPVNFTSHSQSDHSKDKSKLSFSSNHGPNSSSSLVRVINFDIFVKSV
jgi:hypothetical protein